ncbi:MAG: peptide-methionine (S)-S-oxide reductase MsrA [bacterium]
MANQLIHHVSGLNIKPPFPPHLDSTIFGMGCFWGAERLFWQQAGVYVTAVGYAGGSMTDPDYRSVCTGTTGHVEVVLVVFDPAEISYGDLLRLFWESHDPTQGDRQGNDIGTQYRSVIYCSDDDQLTEALASKAAYQLQLDKFGMKTITTGISKAPAFYYAENDHQQYLSKHPTGYCGLAGTGVACAS